MKTFKKTFLARVWISYLTLDGNTIKECELDMRLPQPTERAARAHFWGNVVAIKYLLNSEVKNIEQLQSVKLLRVTEVTE